jgi:uracil-DNA glycosylase
VETVTDRTRNPFDMSAPAGERPAVFGYGDANADLHLVGDHPGVHGGRETGRPFESSPVLAVLEEAGVVVDGSAARDGGLFRSYLHVREPPRAPPDRPAPAFGPVFDAELRAVCAHVLLPVGDRATRHVLRTYGRAGAVDGDPGAVRARDWHASELPGRGFLVVPVRDPDEWRDGDRRALRRRLAAVFDGDYRQTCDLGRFSPGADQYLVR